MSASNSIHIMGRITRDLELKYTASGVAVCAFAVAVSRMYTDKDGNKRKAVETLVNSVAFTGEKADGAGSGSTRPPMPTTPPPVAAEEPTYDEIEYSVNDEDLLF